MSTITYSGKVDRSISIMYIHEEEDDSALSSVNKRSRTKYDSRHRLLVDILVHSMHMLVIHILDDDDIRLFTLTSIFSPTYNKSRTIQHVHLQIGSHLVS